MGLQVRVRHALGERLVDLADRPVDRPLIVGRAREADLKIPSVTVASEHCALFVHNRQWVLQDTSGGGATFVNGVAAEGPTLLCVGDMIVLGTDATPATIVIDPAGVAQGRTGHPAETHDAVPVSRAATMAPRAAAAPRVAASMPRAAAAAPRAAASSFQEPAPAPTYAASAQAAPAAAQDPWNAQPAAADDPFAGWSPAAPVADSTQAFSPYRRRKSSKGISPVVLGITIAVCVAMIAGVAVAVFLHLQARPEPVVVVEKVEAAVKEKEPVSLFGNPGGAPDKAPESTPPVHQSPADQSLSEAVNSDKPATASPSRSPRPDQTPAPRSDQTPVPGSDPAPTPAAAGGSNPHKDEAAWSEVRDAFTLADVGKAIVKSEDYRHQHESESFKDLDALIEEAMDTLWWNRVLALWAQQNGFLDDLKKKDKEIREETSAAFKATLQGERKEIENKLAEVQRHLNGDMGYTATEPPQLDNKELMGKLRADRDKDKFASWKVGTLKYIKTHHGSMPWDG